MKVEPKNTTQRVVDPFVNELPGDVSSITPETIMDEQLLKAFCEFMLRKGSPIRAIEALEKA